MLENGGIGLPGHYVSRVRSRYFLYRLLMVIGLLLVVSAGQAQDVSILTIQVIDEEGDPIEFAALYYEEGRLSRESNALGMVRFNIDPARPEINIRVFYVGKKSVTRTFYPSDTAEVQQLMIEDLSLTLDEVVVTPQLEESELSNSSIRIDRQAIEQMQAFSLMDVLNNLPGKATVAPDLHSPQTITLRSDADGLHQFSNSLGVAIIVDGSRLSNDANMQNRSLSRWGMAGSILSANDGYGALDVPFQGIDLRDIPVENIERIEVIQGVASARYGELTDGAVIVDRQAGKTPLSLTTNVNGGSSSIAVSRGFSLPAKAGAINVGVNYLNSNKDPRDRLKKFNRLAASFMWTTYFGTSVKNTFSFDYNQRLDGVQQDPDDGSWQKSHSKSRGTRFSNRLRVNLKDYWIDQISLSVNYNRSKQDTYRQWLLNGPPKPYTNKDTTGIYEGYFLPGNYLAYEQIIGVPETAGADLLVNGQARTGRFSHKFTAGINYSYSNNGGDGILLDPDRPRWVNTGDQNERPYDFEFNPAVQNVGFFLEDNMNTLLGGRRFWASLGIRQDFQNGYGTLQPRINLRYELADRWQFNLAYGRSTKSPTLAHRYPVPTWLDIPLLQVYTGFADQSLYLVYTRKIIPDNSNLKPSRSMQLETGIRYEGDFFTSALFAYMKRNRDGFSSNKVFEIITLPEFAYNYEEGQPITYYQTGNYRTYAGDLGYYNSGNDLSSDNYGLEWTIRTSTVKPLRTRFRLATSVSRSIQQNSARQTLSLEESVWSESPDAPVYAVYPASSHYAFTAMSKLNSITHISKLGFVVNLNADLFWSSHRYTPQQDRYPVGYITRSLEYVAIDQYDPEDPIHSRLKLFTEKESSVTVPMVYGILNMRIAKEISRSIRISITGYNFFNLLPEHLDHDRNGNPVVYSYNNRVSLTAGIIIKL